jgi:hypothetical protein
MDIRRKVRKGLTPIVCAAMLALSLCVSANAGAAERRHIILLVSDAADFLSREEGSAARETRASTIAQGLRRFLSGDPQGLSQPYDPARDRLSAYMVGDIWSPVGRPKRAKAPHCPQSGDKMGPQPTLPELFVAEAPPEDLSLVPWLLRMMKGECRGLAAAVTLPRVADLALPMAALTPDALSEVDEVVVVMAHNFTGADNDGRLSVWLDPATLTLDGVPYQATALQRMVQRDTVRSAPSRRTTIGANGMLYATPPTADSHPLTIEYATFRPAAASGLTGGPMAVERLASPKAVKWLVEADSVAFSWRGDAVRRLARIEAVPKPAVPDGGAPAPIDLTNCTPPRCLPGEESGEYKIFPLEGSARRVLLAADSKLILTEKLHFKPSIYPFFLATKTHAIEGQPGPRRNTGPREAMPWWVVVKVGGPLVRAYAFDGKSANLSDDLLMQFAAELSVDGLSERGVIDAITTAREEARTFSMLIWTCIGAGFLGGAGLFLWWWFRPVRLDARGAEGKEISLAAKGETVEIGEVVVSRVGKKGATLRCEIASVEVDGRIRSKKTIALQFGQEQAVAEPGQPVEGTVSSAGLAVHVRLIGDQVPEAEIDMTAEVGASLKRIVKVTLEITQVDRPDRPAVVGHAIVEAKVRQPVVNAANPIIHVVPGALALPQRASERTAVVATIRLQSGNLCGCAALPLTESVVCTNVELHHRNLRPRPIPLTFHFETIDDDRARALSGARYMLLSGGYVDLRMAIGWPVDTMLAVGDKISFTVAFGNAETKNVTISVVADESDRTGSGTAAQGGTIGGSGTGAGRGGASGAPARPRFEILLTNVADGGHTRGIVVTSAGRIELEGRPISVGGGSMPALSAHHHLVRGSDAPFPLLEFELHSDATLALAIDMRIESVNAVPADGIEWRIPQWTFTGEYLTFTGGGGHAVETVLQPGQPVHAGVMFGQNHVKRWKAPRDAVTVNFVLVIAARPAGQAIGRPVSWMLLRQPVSVRMTMSASAKILAIDFGTSAVVAAVGEKRGERQVINLQMVTKPQHPERNLIELEGGGKHAGYEPTFLRSMLYCRSDSPVTANHTTYPDAKPGYPAFLGGSPECGAPGFVELPADWDWSEATNPEYRQRLIIGIKAWLGVAANSIPLATPMTFREGGQTFTRERLPFPLVMQSAFAALLSAYIYDRLDPIDFGSVVVAYPNTFTDSQREMLVKTLVRALGRDDNWDEPGRVIAARESECVLYEYLELLRERARTEHFDFTETAVVAAYDFGAGTLDVSVADVGWEQVDAAQEHVPWVKIHRSIALDVAGHELDQVITRIIHEELVRILEEIPGTYYPLVCDDPGRENVGYWPAMRQFSESLLAAKREYSRVDRVAQFFCVNVGEIVSDWSSQAVQELVERGTVPECRDPWMDHGPRESEIVAVRDGDQWRAVLRIPAATMSNHPMMEEFASFVTERVLDAAALSAGLAGRHEINQIIPAGRGVLWPDLRNRLRRIAAEHLGVFQSDFIEREGNAKAAVAKGAVALAVWRRAHPTAPAPDQDAQYAIRIGNKILYENDWPVGIDIPNMEVEVVTYSVSESVILDLDIDPHSRFYKVIGRSVPLQGYHTFVRSKIREGLEIRAIDDLRRPTILVSPRNNVGLTVTPPWPAGNVCLTTGWPTYS